MKLQSKSPLNLLRMIVRITAEIAMIRNRYDFKSRRRTNVQQLTCKIDLPFSFYYLFFSFVLRELKPFVLKGKVLGEKF